MATNIPGDINQTKQRNAAPVAKKQTSFDITNTPGLKPAGVPTAGKPVATPGYDAQAADDRLQQYSGHPVVGANGQTSYQGVVDRSGAVQPQRRTSFDMTNTPVAAKPLSDPLTSHVASVTGKPPGSAMTPQDLQALGLNTAAGLMVQQNLVNQPGAGDNPARAARMQASYDQPVTSGQGVPIQQVAAGPAQQQQAQGRVADGFEDFGNRVTNFSTGAAQTGAGLISTIPGAMIDYGRQGLAAVSGGQLTEQQKNSARTMAGDFMGEGVDRLAGAFDGTAEATRNLIGATKAQPQAANPAAVNPAVKPATVLAGAESTAAPGYNNASEQTVERPDLRLEQADGGKTSFNVQGQQGDARSAIENNEAALVDRRKMSELSRKAQIEGEIGNGPGNRGNVSEYAIEQAQRKAKVTGSATDRANFDRLAGIGTEQSASARKQAEEVDPRWKQDADRQKAEAEAAKATTDQQVSDATAQQQAARAKNLAFLEAQMVDPNLSVDQRTAAINARDVLTTPVKDRGVVLEGGSDGEGGKQASTWRDLTSPPQGRTTATKAEVADAAKRSGETEEQVMIRMRAQGITING